MMQNYYLIIVLNRWGNVVFEEKYYQNTFSSYTNENKKLNNGVYYYLFYSICGDKKAITFQGYFHILTEKLYFCIMHLIEPYFAWRDFYIASEDPSSPFYDKINSEFEFTDSIYNYLIHPQWDNFGSSTLFLKIIYVDYDENFCVIEFIGEWNDAIENDIMTLKRDIIEPIMEHGINKFILIGENVLNFHYSDDCYYEEWFDEVEDGWIALVNFQDHVIREFEKVHVDHYFVMKGELDELDWRTNTPQLFYEKVSEYVTKRLG